MLALRGAEVLLMPHAARFKPWPETPEGEAAARRHSHDFAAVYALRARDNLAAIPAVRMCSSMWVGNPVRAITAALWT